ncbi:ATP-dependent helicase HrpB [Thalassotalea aquiviva]|uniref:ATP-dependent helicase HrpB n=1 Tax=Thalassotalea aquiviva TaxID=3242415 RepID=UPI00352BC5D4
MSNSYSDSSVLPIYEIKSSLLQAIENHNMVILNAPPGAGKSTCLPLWLLDIEKYQNEKIYLLQPRRIAAKNVASYLAQQLGEDVGQTVGYRLRNETKVSPKTRLEVVTEGILTQLIQQDPELTGCSLVIFDEFHERSLHSDLAFALCQDIQAGLREDLSLLLMSATLASTHLQQALPGVVTLTSHGRSFPVEIDYRPPSTLRTWRENALAEINKAIRTHQGSILVFLPGVADIRYLIANLKGQLPPHMLLTPLYGELSLTAQQQAINPAPAKMQKLVLATNIAETSLTIDGIDLVIDSGLEKVAIYDVNTQANILKLQQTAKDSAIQRAGRAGRLGPGRCIRLYSQEDFSRRNEHNISEIMQSDITSLILEAARWGVNSLAQLPLLEHPKATTEQAIWTQFELLGMVDQQHKLTKHGHSVSKLSCQPRLGHMLVKAKALEGKIKENHLTLLACTLAALIEERDIIRHQQANQDCDIEHRLRLFSQKPEQFKQVLWQVKRLASQLKISSKVLSSSFTHLPVNMAGSLLALAFPEQVAKNRGKLGEFLTASQKGVFIFEADTLANEDFIVAARLTTVKHKTYVSLGCKVELKQLQALNIFQPHTRYRLEYDEQGDKILSFEQKLLGPLLLSQTPKPVNDDNLVAQLWAQQVVKHGISWLPWQEKDLQLRTRMRWLEQHSKDVDLPNVEDAELLANLAIWFMPFVGQIKSKAQLAKQNLSDMLLSMFDYQQQQTLNRLAPEFFIGPTKRQCPIRYSLQQNPIVSLPMQELYGLQITPMVGDKQSGKQVPLILEILSPAKRPIQVTQDLQAFWQGSYKAVQKEMKSQYPKHYWPDDPANAEATRKTKRQLSQ